MSMYAKSRDIVIRYMQDSLVGTVIELNGNTFLIKEVIAPIIPYDLKDHCIESVADFMYHHGDLIDTVDTPEIQLTIKPLGNVVIKQKNKQ